MPNLVERSDAIDDTVEEVFNGRRRAFTQALQSLLPQIDCLLHFITLLCDLKLFLDVALVCANILSHLDVIFSELFEVQFRIFDLLRFLLNLLFSLGYRRSRPVTSLCCVHQSCVKLEPLFNTWAINAPLLVLALDGWAGAPLDAILLERAVPAGTHIAVSVCLLVGRS